MEKELYIKVMAKIKVSDDELQKIAQGKSGQIIEKKLEKGIEIDGEVYFPTTDYNEALYEIHDDGYEINADGYLDGIVIKSVD